MRQLLILSCMVISLSSCASGNSGTTVGNGLISKPIDQAKTSQEGTVKTASTASKTSKEELCLKQEGKVQQIEGKDYCVLKDKTKKPLESLEP